MTTLIISNEEMNDIMKKVKSLEESCLQKQGFSGIIKEQNKGVDFSAWYYFIKKTINRQRSYSN